MLRVWEIQDRTVLHQLLQQLDISKQTWLLSDLRTKFEIQDYYLDTKDYFLEESVLRISDLWKKILLRSHPEFRLVSPQAALLHLRFFLRQFGEKIGLPESSENTLLKWMTDIAPIYFHPDGQVQIEQWFNTHPDQANAWKEWWLRSKAAFAYFENKKLILPAWIPSYLQSIQDLSIFWDKDLIVDLTSQLSFVESELLRQLARKQDVLVLAPVLVNKDDRQKYTDLLHAYENLKGLAQELKKINSTSHDPKRSFNGFTSTLGSIRQTTATVRKWIDSGIAPHQIAVVAPDIEGIWPVLSFHFEKEGIPVAKSTLSSFQASVAVQYFLSKLRSLSMNLSTRDLELSYYSEMGEVGQKNVDLAYERFEALYKNLYDESDYGRFQKIKESLRTEFDIKAPMSNTQFIFSISKLFPEGGENEIPTWVEVLVRDLLASFDQSLLLMWSDWVSFCEASMSRHEVMEKEPDRDGVLVASLMSAHFLKVTHRLFLELCEENLKTRSDRGLMPQSARVLSQDLGFWLTHSEKGDLEFEFEWGYQCGIKEDHFYFGSVSLGGQITTPSSIYLKRKSLIEGKDKKKTHFESPDTTCFDVELEHSTTMPRILEDLGQKEMDLLPSVKTSFLSPSALESFHKCPFIFFAQQSLGLKTFPEIDLELNRKADGEAFHALFERILSRGLETWTENSLQDLIEELRPTHFVNIIESLWPAHKKRMLKLCTRFVNFEKSWRKEHPRIRKSLTEVSWQGDLANRTFRGRMDRVDISDRNEMIVIDYKRTGSQLKGANQWIENGSVQMLFYMHALENGWAQGLEGQVVGAFYYVVKNFSREKGFELQVDSPGFLSPTKMKNQKNTEDGKKKLLSDFERFVTDLVTRLQRGEMKAVPSDFKTCDNCDWRRLCRAPHLS